MTEWVRLWHDMPTDPKWRTIARKSGQPLACVIALFNLLMINASSNAQDRGSLKNWSDDDAASALDMEPEQVAAIIDAMQGKVLDGQRLTGWERRQPKREDGTAAKRKAEWKERQTRARNAAERSGTQRNAPETDTDTEVLEADASNTSAQARLQVSEPDADDPPRPSKRAKPEEIRQALSAVIGDELAEAVIDHRRRLRKPLTARAASLLAGKFANCRDGPVAAAEAMIANGWQGFEPHWMDARNGNGNRTHPHRSSGIMDAAQRIIADIEAREAAGRESVRGFGADRGGEDGAFGGQVLALPRRA